MKRFWKKHVKMPDMCKLKRLFSLKPALLVMAFFLVFNLGKMSPSTPCLSTDNVPEGVGRLDNVLAPRQVKAQQVKDSMSRLDAISGQENNDLVLNYNDHGDIDNIINNINNDNNNNNNNINNYDHNINKEPVEIYKPMDEHEPEILKPKLEVKAPEPVAKVPVVTKKPATVKPATAKPATSKPAVAAKKPAVAASGSKQTSKPPSGKSGGSNGGVTRKPIDYYGAWKDSHFAGMKRMGYSSVTKHSYKSYYIIDPHVYTKGTITKVPGYRKKKLIACYNCPQRFFASNKYNNDFKSCPWSECELSQASGMNNKADMMLFWQDPEVERPPPRPKGQLWMFLSWEAPPNRAYPRPNHNWFDAFNYTMSYLRDADFSMPYDSLVWRDESLLHSDEYYIEAARGKTKTAAWWVSHCSTRSKRRAYVDEMKKYIPDLDIYGACGDLTCAASHSDDCWKSLNTTYRFYLAFENSFCPEYVTEKFYKTFRYRYPIIPVVRGGFDYNKYFPKDILINAANFANAKDLSNHLIQLSKDPVKLGKMYKEKDRFGMLNRKMDWCDFCQKLHTGGFKKQVIHDVIQYSHSRPCWDAPNDIK